MPPSPYTSMELKLSGEGRRQDAQEERQREREMRRLRGEISCSECRRMKIKCDRKVPCSSCVKRHCEDRCPNGTIRSAATDMKLLQVELLKAQRRIKALEDALQSAHAKVAESVHPLLVDVHSSPSDSPGAEPQTPPSDAEQDVLETLGTLTITDGGESRFFGPSAASESLILSTESTHATEDTLPEMPPEIYRLSSMWPFTPVYSSLDTLRATIDSYLSSYERASALCEAYLENLSWFHMGISRQQLFEELLPLVYHRNERTKDMKVHVRDLAMLFSVFACGASGDLTQKPDNHEGRLYYYLARATMGLNTNQCRGCIQAIMTLSFLGLYHLFACPTSDSEESWKLHALGMGVASTIGLHRDPARWNLSPQVRDRRRRVFWSLFCLDNYRALSCGRPPMISLDSIDVEYPEGATKSDSETGDPSQGHAYWQFEFTRRCLAPVVQRFCANPKPVTYAEAMQFDKKVREYEAERSAWLQQISLLPSDTMDSVFIVKKILSHQNCTTLLLGIHRNFFARAVIEHPDDPLRSPFAPSFLTALRLATTIIQKLQECVQINLPMVLRVWAMWGHSLNAGVIVGSIASRCPTSTFAPAAYVALENVISSFRTAASEHPTAARGLPILLRLQEKAIHASLNTQAQLDPHVKAEEEHELNILRGTSRLVPQKEIARRCPFLVSPVPDSKAGSPASTSTPRDGLLGELNGASATLPSDPLTKMSTCPLDVDEWMSDINNIMASYQQQEYPSLSTAGLAAADNSFASLAPDVLMPPLSSTTIDAENLKAADPMLNNWEPCLSGTSALDDMGIFTW